MAEQFKTNFRAWNPAPARTGKVVMTFSNSMPLYNGGVRMSRSDISVAISGFDDEEHQSHK